MKKTITLALALLLCAALAACSGSAVPSATETEAAPATTAAPAVTDAPATLITPTEASTAPEVQNTADNSSDPDRLIVNEVKLASIEKNDTFPVKFTSYNFISDQNLTLSFNIQNGTDKTLSKITCFVLAFNDDTQASSIDIGSAVDLGLGDDAYIQKYTYDKINLASNTTSQLKLDTEQKNISEFRAIVASYTADGQEVKNPTAYEWYKNAYKNKVTDNSAIFDKLVEDMGDDSDISKDDRGAVTLEP